MRLIESSMNNNYKVYEIDVTSKYDPRVQMNKNRKIIAAFLENEIKRLNGIKINISLDISFEKDEKKLDAFFTSKARNC